MMMRIVDVLALSAIQAITEFLPVSSTAHLKLYYCFMHLPPSGLEIEVALHASSLLAVLIYFHKDMIGMLRALMDYIIPKHRSRALKSNHFKLLQLLMIATIPAVLVGFFIKRAHITLNEEWLLALNMALFGGILFWADTSKTTQKSISYKQALFIGMGQVLAFLPGVSRSGICLTVARFLEIDRVTATRFAFLLSFPTILGATVLTAFDMIRDETPIYWPQLLSMIAFASILGIAVINIFLKFLEKHSFSLIAIYRVFLGSFLLWLSRS